MDVKLFTRTQLDELILELSGLSQITPIISRQISRFVITDKMSFLEIARCVDYYVEILGLEIKPEYGISFVPNIREATQKYFKQLELDKQKQQQEAEKVIKYQDKNIIINIKSYNLLNKPRPPKSFDMGAIDVNEEDDTNDSN